MPTPDRVDHVLRCVAELALHLDRADAPASLASAFEELESKVNGQFRAPLIDHAVAASVGLMNDLESLFRRQTFVARGKVQADHREAEWVAEAFVEKIERWLPNPGRLPALPSAAEISAVGGPKRMAAIVAGDLFGVSERSMHERASRMEGAVVPSFAGHPAKASEVTTRMLEALGWRRDVAFALGETAVTMGRHLQDAEPEVALDFIQALTRFLHMNIPNLRGPELDRVLDVEVLAIERWKRTSTPDSNSSDR